MLECVGFGGCIKVRHYVQWISWINQPSGYSLCFLLAEVHTGESLRSFLLLPWHSSQDTMDGLVFWANWCDGGEWMGKRKSGIWHLAVITALWPRLVECWVGHINNKPTAELLWLGWWCSSLSAPQPEWGPPEGVDWFTQISGSTT